MQVIFGECELEVGSEQPAKEPAKEGNGEKRNGSIRPPPEAASAPVTPADSNGAAS
jgi:hypothetical protein